MFFLITVIILMTIFLIFKNGFDLLSPSITSNLVWVFSLVFFVLMKSYWEVEISIETIFYLFLGIFFFSLPAFFSDSIYKKNIEKNKMLIIYKIGKIEYIFLTLYLIFSTYKLYTEIYQISILSGNTSDSLSSIISYARYGRTHYNLTFGRTVANILRMNNSLIIVLGFIFIRKGVAKSWRKAEKKMIIPIIWLVLLMIFSGGRVEVINSVISLIFIYFLEFGYFKGWKNYKMMLKLSKKIAGITLLLFLIFIFQGVYLLGRMGDGTALSVFHNVARYTSAAIPCFDAFVKNNDLIKSNYFAFNTLLPIWGTISHFFPVKELSPAFFPFIYLDNHKINIYTTLMPYMSDFGIGGLILIQFLKGIFYQWFYVNIKNRRFEKVNYILIYSCLIPPIIFSFFDEMLLRNVNSFIVRIIFIMLFSKIFLKKEEKFFISKEEAM